MSHWLKLSHHHHSGRLRPHEHTSYLPLGVLLFVVGFALSAFTVSAASPGPESGSVGLTGTVPGKPPTVASTILTPRNQQHFSTSPITVTGTCPANTLVELYKNNIFAGSTICSESGKYSVEIDLLIGQNILISRVYDALNQAGPDSDPVTIFYDALPAQADALTSLDFGSQLVLGTDAVFRGIFPDDEMNVPIDIIGGAPPYAVNVQWGDSTNKVVSRSDNVGFTTTHIYKKAGNYQVNFQATDAAGHVAFLSVAAIVNGQPDAALAAGTTPTTTANRLLVLWPLYTSAVAVVASFWFGERREKRVLKARGQLVTS